MNGYEQLRTSAAWLDLGARGKIKVTGEDRARLLHAMSTNHVQQLQPGQGCYAYFLSAQGRILADANILCRPDHFLVDTEPELTDKLRNHLDQFIIVDDVVLEDLTASLATIAIEGPRSADILSSSGIPIPGEEYASIEWGTRLVCRLSATGQEGFWIITPWLSALKSPARVEQGGAAAADAEAFNTVRIENGRPRYGEDITERFLSQETNQDRALHFSKGCYLGQEIVERVRSRAQIHRRLRPVTIDTADVPAPGTKLARGGSPVAEITSAAFSPALGKVAALAYVRTDAERPGTELNLGDVTATVVASPREQKPESADVH